MKKDWFSTTSKYRGESKSRWPVSYSLPNPHYARLDKLAKAKNISRADVTKQIVIMFLEKMK